MIINFRLYYTVVSPESVKMGMPTVIPVDVPKIPCLPTVCAKQLLSYQIKKDSMGISSGEQTNTVSAMMIPSLEARDCRSLFSDGNEDQQTVNT